MNNEKAREHFSAYYEGGLDSGLKQQLEHKFQVDSGLKNEYETFARTMRELESMTYEVPEPQFDLHDRIMARIDLFEHQQKANRKPTLFVWMRNLSLAGIAAVAIWGTMTQLNTNGTSATASLTGNNATKVQPQVQAPFNIECTTPNNILLNFNAKIGDQMTVKDEDGKLLRDSITAESTSIPINNPNPDAELIVVETKGADQVLLIALPGQPIEPEAAGEGNIKDFAKAVSAKYGTPVAITTSNPELKVKWNLEDTNSVNAVLNTLKDLKYSCEQRSSKVLWIQEN